MDNEISKGEFCVVYKDLNYPPDFDFIDKAIISRIINFNRNNKTYFECQQSLACYFDISQSNASRRLKKLFDSKWVVKSKTKYGTNILTVPTDHYLFKMNKNYSNCIKIIQNEYNLCKMTDIYNNNITTIEETIEENINPVSANASTPLPEVKPYLTLEQVKDTYKDHKYYESIVKWYEYKISKKQLYKSNKEFELALKLYEEDFPLAVEDSIKRKIKGIYLYSKPKAPRQEWQIKRDIEPKTIILFNDLLFSKLDPDKFESVCKETELKQELKIFCKARNILNKKDLNDYFIAIESDNSPLYFKRLSDFTSSLTSYAVKKELAVQTN